MRIPTVYIMRGGAPEKIGLDGHLYHVSLMDHCNLADIPEDEVNSILKSGDFILPSEEADYNDLNLKYGANKNANHILLCRTVGIGGFKEFLDYKYVKKSSPFYLNWNSTKSGINFPKTRLVDRVCAKYKEYKVWKTDNESGSRGVLVDPSRMEWSNFIEHKKQTKILVQDLVPQFGKVFKLDNYYTFDIQIKDKKLLGYCFVRIPSNSYPRWVRGYIVRNNKLDKMIKKFSDYMINICGITDGFINVDGVATADYSEFWMYEINWRYSGIGNVLRCLGIDIIYQYLYNLPYQIPIGEFEYCYSYTPVLLPRSGVHYKDIKE